MPERLRPTLLAALALTVAASVATPAFAQSGDQRPSTPAGLFATVYSATGGSVRWQRSSDREGLVLGYEVSRDGEVLGVFDALSYVDRSLEPGRSYRYRVRAVDSSGQRSARAFVTLETLDARPAAPQEVRADVYSRTTAELFWKRSNVFGERYLIKRDGQEVATTDGTSYIDRTLSTQRPYLFEVIALNRQGERSTPTRLFVDTSGGSGSSGGDGGGGTIPTEPPVEPPVLTLAAPTGLRFSSYSSTTVELFWDRPTTPGLRYEVRRDGTVVTNTDGTSHLDRAIGAGVARTYEIIAIDPAGRRSEPSRIVVEAENPNPPVNEGLALDELLGELIVALGVYEADVDDVVRVNELAELASNTALGSRPVAGTDVLQAFPEGLNDEERLLEEESMTRGTRYDCALGGSFAREDFSFERGSEINESAVFDATIFRFEQCRLAESGGETVVGGDFFVSDHLTAGPDSIGRPRERDERRHRWADFSYLTADGHGLEIDGRFVYTRQLDVENPSTSEFRERFASVLRYVRTVDGEPITQVEDVRFFPQSTFRGDAIPIGNSLFVFGKVRNVATEGSGIIFPRGELQAARRQQPDGSSADWTTLGSLTIQANDGGFLQVTATEATDDTLFVDLEFTDRDGSTRQSERVALPYLSPPLPRDIAAAIETAIEAR